MTKEPIVYGYSVAALRMRAGGEYAEIVSSVYGRDGAEGQRDYIEMTVAPDGLDRFNNAVRYIVVEIRAVADGGAAV